MSGESAKRRIKNNQAILSRVGMKIVLGNLLSLVLTLISKKRVLSPMNILTFSLEILIFWVLRRASYSKVVRGPNKMEILSEGADLGARGCLHILIDTLYLTIATQLTSFFLGYKAWMFFLLIPVSAYYEMFMRRERRRVDRERTCSKK
ncbi:hypothetical protein NEFER03_1639 [Nematocida sp. LUAm3]|nr:hypothetical protein NEFER03_1639 [Nematocida sp. LUAm3]KAI5174663.1 hypothetical protein NEFER02_0773 [Nematocida sp. LUAm2]KAI5177927.1 hypothetical protein NEFER01_1129 [Nematocida sp. LUAm1]